VREDVPNAGVRTARGDLRSLPLIDTWTACPLGVVGTRNVSSRCSGVFDTENVARTDIGSLLVYEN
jgi:hypothetical protein